MLGIPFSFSIDLAISMTMRFFLSNTPFCCGVYATASCFSMPSSSQNLSNSRDVYSYPRLLLSTFIYFPHSTISTIFYIPSIIPFTTSKYYWWYQSYVWSFTRRRYIFQLPQKKLELYSILLPKYFLNPWPLPIKHHQFQYLFSQEKILSLVCIY